MIGLQIIKLNIEDVKPYKNNAKRHTREQVEQIKNSIKRFGNLDPIGIWGEQNIIVEGHGRYIALQELGYTEVECIRLDHLTDEERKAYTLAHNKINANTGFDDSIVSIELENLQDLDFDLELTGFEDWEIDNLLNPVTDEELEDFFTEKEEKPKEPKQIQCPNCELWFEQ